MSIALKAENVSIRYITGDFKDIGIKEYVVRKLTNNYHVNEFMAVDGVSFELESGDMLGIIGTNGAGKSTLLKAVAGIMEPTHGKITANGEVAALLELGSGFDGDLTVKENAYLRGAMLGYTKEFMDETYDQIIDFAELREFEDRPFKQLSSGMKSRLAFSIASLVKPDILILDEVLSVGDGAFQEKSAKKMREIISQGATTILVSHSLSQIRELCNKVLWLDHGKQVAFGETQEICDTYERYLNGEYELQISEKKAAEDELITPHLTEQQTRVSSIDGLRGILALIIALFHFGQAYPIGNLFHRGYFAVELFFMISGFVFIQSLDKKGDNIHPSSEFASKLCRLYPAYLFSVVSLVVLYSAAWFHGNPVAWIFSDAGHYPSLIAEILGIQVTGIANLVYINGPIWYVSALLCATAILMFAYWLLPRRAFDMATLCSVLGIYVTLFVQNPSMDSAGYLDESKLISIPLIRGIAGMCLGIVLYQAYQYILKNGVRCTRKIKILGDISLLTVILTLIVTEPSRTNFLLFVPASIGILCLFLIGKKEKFCILESRIAQYMGKISYTFFVMQSFFQNVVSIYATKWTQNAAILNAMYIFLNIFCATLLYPILEIKIPRLLKYGNRRNRVK